MSTSITIQQAIHDYLDSVRLARSKNTADTYTHALNSFSRALQDRDIDPEEFPVDRLSVDAVGWFALVLKNFSSSTEQLYLVAVKGFYEYLAAERLADINLPRLRLLIRQRARRPGLRLPQFPREQIEHIIEYAIKLVEIQAENDQERLRLLRDRAFLITLADTGLRVHEACGLHRGDVDRQEGKASLIGKGDREAIVRFSSRSLAALRLYLNARSQLDGAAGKPLASLPIFARHDRGAGKKIKPITTVTGRNIVNQRATEALGAEAAASITPHSFRHYFVTTVLRASGNLKLAQELARHRNIQVTQRYAHLSADELDRGYAGIFDEDR